MEVRGPLGPEARSLGIQDLRLWDISMYSISVGGVLVVPPQEAAGCCLELN